MNQPIRVVLIDDHSKVHLAIAALLTMLDDIELVAQGSSGQEAVDLCTDFQPDIVLMDVIMPGMNGIDATRDILAQHPNIKIVALSGFQDEDSVKAMLAAGAVGYVLKTSSAQEIASAIRSAYAGSSILSREVIQTLLTPTAAINPRVEYGLTRRELEILQLMAAGSHNPEIAEAMTLSLSTVKFHVSNILQKLGVSSRTEAVSLALEKKLVN